VRYRCRKDDYEKVGTEKNDCAKADAVKNGCEIPVQKRMTMRRLAQRGMTAPRLVRKRTIARYR
jgi:hypothetical protein